MWSFAFRWQKFSFSYHYLAVTVATLLRTTRCKIKIIIRSTVLTKHNLGLFSMRVIISLDELSFLFQLFVVLYFVLLFDVALLPCGEIKITDNLCIQRLACSAISASAKLLAWIWVFRLTVQRRITSVKPSLQHAGPQYVIVQVLQLATTASHTTASSSNSVVDVRASIGSDADIGQTVDDSRPCTAGRMDVVFLPGADWHILSASFRTTAAPSAEHAASTQAIASYIGDISQILLRRIHPTYFEESLVTSLSQTGNKDNVISSGLLDMLKI